MKNIFLLILLIPSICFADVWVKFTLTQTPYKNYSGKVIKPNRIIIYNKDRTKITYGGDYIVPKLNNILERHQSRDMLLVKAKDISSLGIVGIKYTILEEKEARVILRSLGVADPPVIKIESGVTQ
uniref:Uncharacterized protein n=1 Tax=viral metagenome TaxID=1070528 RepID=A0A6H1ZJS1_9ZZZZ